MKTVLLFLTLASFTLATDRVVPREGTEWCNIWMPNANKHDLPRVLLIGDARLRSRCGETAQRQSLRRPSRHLALRG